MSVIQWSVPVCGLYGPETTSDCPFLAFDILSGSWNASWAKHASERPTKICSPEQLDSFFRTFPILETPMKQLGVNTMKEGDSMDVSRVLLQLKHHCHDCANWVITFVPEEWRPSPHLLFWFAVVTFFIMMGLGVTALFWWLRGKSAQNQERLEAENKMQELEEKIRIMESEKGCVELQAETLQQRLEAQLTLQQTLDSENNDRESKVKEVIRSQTQEMQELKQELEQTECLFKTEMMFHAQQMQEILMDVRVVEENLEVERGESEILRKNLIDVSVRLEELKSPLFVTSVKKGEVLLKNRKTQIKDKLNLEMKNRRALGEVQNMREQWQRMEQALQQKAAEVESERRDKEMEVKTLLRSHKLKVHKIEEKHLQTEISYKAEIESLKKQSQEIWDTSECELTACKKEINALRKQLDDVSAEPQLAPFGSTPGRSHQQTTHNETYVVATQTDFSGSSDESPQVEREKQVYLKRLWAEQQKTLDLEGKMEALKQDRDALDDQNCDLEQHTSALQGRVRNMTDLCQQKEQTLQYFLNKTLSTFGMRMHRMAVQEPRLSPVTETTGSWSEEDL
ncbi:hypothetical protein AAFF_G00066450 [Aldrovandia affinis]|uniref:Uncharacterized protein n=1 Tax=Aldrovandia affinis TaxID=143900 RepID=A0AAD7T439_9TELE|nr:hypothetical protein AAFF_G00066450 [Aldrovandia affinis]